jgi:hypothetical protein
MDIRLAYRVEKAPRQTKERLLHVAQAIQRRGIVLHARLVQLVRYLGLPSREIRSLAHELAAVGVVEIVPPGYRRRGVRYHWIGSPEPIEIPPCLVQRWQEMEIVRALAEALRNREGGWISHSHLLRRVSPSSVRARDVQAFIFKAKRFGLLTIGRTLHGGRAYRWAGFAPEQVRNLEDAWRVPLHERFAFAAPPAASTPTVDGGPDSCRLPDLRIS